MDMQAIQKKVLSVLAGKIDDFYLVGGTALSLYYFNHRESQDLDFFTQKFNSRRVEEVIKYLAGRLKKKATLKAGQTRKDKVRILVYLIHFNKRQDLKIDFVEDYVEPIKPPNLINGIKVSSLEDIYLKKIYTIAGTHAIEDSTGRLVNKGGRQEAKDFYDIYCLSSIFMPLSKFISRYCSQLMLEGVVRWFRTYNRLDMKTGLLELDLKREADYKIIELHFKKEIDKIIEKEVGFK